MGGQAAAFDGALFAQTDDDVLYQTVLYDLDGYRLSVPNGEYAVTLRFCEPHYEDAGKRVFGVTVQGRRVIESLDLYGLVGKNVAYDRRFEGVKVTDGTLAIGFPRIVEYPCIAAIGIEGRTEASNQVASEDWSRRINCGGPAVPGYEADLPPVGSLAIDQRPRDLPVRDFYADWALVEFGPEVAAEAAAIFARLDGGAEARRGPGDPTNLPRPATWAGGPGGIRKDPRPWPEVAGEYAFVDELEALRPRIAGAGALERFDYWLNNMRYLRATGRLACALAAMDRALAAVRDVPEGGGRREAARSTALPVWREVDDALSEASRRLIDTVTTPGGMGTVCNWQSHVIPMFIHPPRAELVGLLGEEAVRGVEGPRAYDGPARLFATTARTVLAEGEDFHVRATMLGGSAMPPTLHWRELGSASFHSVPMDIDGRGVHSAAIPGDWIEDDFECWVEGRGAGGERLAWPPSAPFLCHAVIRLPAD